MQSRFYNTYLADPLTCWVVPTKYYLRNGPAPWSEEDLRTLRELAAVGTPTGVIALKLHRSKIAISAKAAEEHISLDSRGSSKKRKQASADAQIENLADPEQ